MNIGQIARKGAFGSLLLILVVALAFPAMPAGAQEEQPEFPQANHYSRTTPGVLFCDETGGLTIEVTIVGRSDVRRVWINDHYGQERVPGMTDAHSELFDDGTHGDAAAGDRTFTRSGLNPYCDRPALAPWGYGFSDYFPRFELSNGTIAASSHPIRLGVIDQKYRGTFAVRDLGNGLSATAYAFFIEDAGREVISGYPVADVECGMENFVAYQKLYSVMPDAFDLAVVMPGLRIVREQGFSENVPYMVFVANQVKYIGMPIEDNTARFGSAGRLRAAIYNSFGFLDILDHEIGHAWGATLGHTLGMLKFVDLSDAHWIATSDINGQLTAFYEDPDLGYGRFLPNEDGTWRFVQNIESEQNQPYAPLELYAMGLIPAGEVPPVHLFSGKPDLSDPQHVTFPSVRTVTIEEIIAAEGGERTPVVTDGLPTFTMAFIVTQDIPYNDAAYALFSLMSYHLTTREEPVLTASNGWPSKFHYFMPFYWATGGRAALETRLPVDLPDPTGLPFQAAPTPAPADAPTAAPVATEPVTENPAPAEGAPAAGSPGGCSLLAPAALVLLPGILRLRRRKTDNR